MPRFLSCVALIAGMAEASSPRFKSGDPMEVVDRFLDARLNGGYRSAYLLIAKEDRAAATAEEFLGSSCWDMGLASAGSLHGVQVSIDSRSVTGKQAEIRLSIFVPNPMPLLGATVWTFDEPENRTEPGHLGRFFDAVRSKTLAGRGHDDKVVYDLVERVFVLRQEAEGWRISSGIARRRMAEAIRLRAAHLEMEQDWKGARAQYLRARQADPSLDVSAELAHLDAIADEHAPLARCKESVTISDLAESERIDDSETLSLLVKGIVRLNCPYKPFSLEISISCDGERGASLASGSFILLETAFQQGAEPRSWIARFEEGVVGVAKTWRGRLSARVVDLRFPDDWKATGRGETDGASPP